MKRISRITKRAGIPSAAVEAWRAGDVWAAHRALDLAPCEYSPLPRRFGVYGLPDAPIDSDRVIESSWAKIKGIQDELERLYGPPGVKQWPA
jgi:hypothetical protein